MVVMKDKYLITSDNWFVAPDGQEYRAAWGEIEILEDNILGLKTNRNSTNWYAKIGSEEKHVIIAGCQIHYAAKCNEPPSSQDTERTNEQGLKYFQSNLIYRAE